MKKKDNDVSIWKKKMYIDWKSGEGKWLAERKCEHDKENDKIKIGLNHNRSKMILVRW